MSSLTYWKSFTYLHRGDVKLISSEGGFLNFKVKDHDVFRTRAGDWSCNAIGEKRTFDKKLGKWIKNRYGCIFSKKEDYRCSHIRACELLLKKIKEERL
jgi:hypothetical protein